MKQTFNVTGMTCSACSAHVEKAVNKLEAVNKAEVSLMTNSMWSTTLTPSAPRTLSTLSSRRAMGPLSPRKTNPLPFPIPTASWLRS